MVLFMDKRIELLAKNFNKDESKFKIANYDNNIIIEDDNAEYIVVDEETADELCKKNIENLFDDLGIKGFPKDFQYWIIENAIGPEFFYDAAREEIDMLSENEDDYDTMFALEDAIDEHDSDYIITYFINMMGEDEVYEWLKDAIDIDKIAENIMDWYGRGHILASYDGKEIELSDNGKIKYYAYRII